MANLINHTGSSGFTIPLLNGASTLTVRQNNDPEKHKGTIAEALYEKALLLACKRIADSGQTYEEAATAKMWAERFLEQAQV